MANLLAKHKVDKAVSFFGSVLKWLFCVSQYKAFIPRPLLFPCLNDLVFPFLLIKLLLTIPKKNQ